MFGFDNIIQSIWNVLVSIRITDIIDMALLSYLIYHGIRLVRETRAQQLIKGIIVLVGAYVIAVVANLQTMRFILKNCFQWGILAILILFQPELRRIIEKIGRTRVTELGSFFSQSEDDQLHEKWNEAIDAICDASADLSSTKTGALIIIEQKTRLGEQIATGTILNCTPSAAVFGNIFFPNTPLHDGAVIMRDGMILAAGCFLPKPQKEELIAKQLGSRHRAAIGMSENSDALVIVVSEETGTISVAENGELTRGFSKESLKKLLRTRLFAEQEETTSGKEKNTFAGRVMSKWKK
ncbi:MAG: diadenylate cyclase CdaA [Ruminococcus sp.]|nr:diadenylate cyclase CdaA [Ruminococcus sp.]